MPPSPLPRYDVSSRTSGSRWLLRNSTLVSAFSSSWPRAREVVASLERVRDGRVDVGQRTAAGRLFDRVDARPPERRVGRIHDQPPQTILRVPGGRVGANQVLAPLRDLGFRLDEIERRNLPGVDADLVLPRELLRELERSLLHGDVRAAWP